MRGAPHYTAMVLSLSFEEQVNYFPHEESLISFASMLFVGMAVVERWIVA